MIQRNRGLLLVLMLALCAVAHAAGPPAAAVDLNSATVEELTAVRGIGEATAKRIVAFRERHGAFERVDDLLKIRGIGEKSLAKIAPQVTVKRRG